MKTTITLENLKSEIERGFRVLGADRGFDQNATDIIGWRRDGYITEDEYRELRAYNRHVYSELPLDM